MGKKRIRTVGALTYAANLTDSIDLPREYVMSKLLLELTGTMVITSAATAINENPQGLLRRIDILRDGLAPISWDGGALMAYNHFMSGVVPPLVALPATVVATGSFQAYLPLCFESQRTGQPWKTFLPSNRANTLQLRVTWGSGTNLASGGVTSGLAANLNVLSEELMNRPEAIAPEGKFSNLIVSKAVKTFATATSAGKVQLPKEYPYRGILIRAATTGNDGRDLSDAVINSLKLRERLTLDSFECTWNQLRQQNQLDYSLTDDLNSPTAPYASKGYAFLDFVKMGMQDLINPQSFSEFDLFLDVEATTHVTVYLITIQPPPA